MRKKKIIKVDLFKFVRSVFIIFGAILIISLFIGKVIYSHNEIKHKEILISKNQTLWSIALYQQEHNEYYKDKSIAYIINDIKNLNNMNVSILYEGQTLKVNTY